MVSWSHLGKESPFSLRVWYLMSQTYSTGIPYTQNEWWHKLELKGYSKDKRQGKGRGGKVSMGGAGGGI